MKENGRKEEEAGVDPTPQTEKQQLQQGIEDGTQEVCIALHCLLVNIVPLVLRYLAVGLS